MYYEDAPKKFNWTLVLIVAAAVIFYVNYTNDSPREVEVSDSSNTLSRGYATNNTEEEEMMEDETPTLPTNACGYTNYGFANYEGTNKEGMDCSDALSQDQDTECVLNPPDNYDGVTNKVTLDSSPEITCCSKDGTCQWL